MRKLEVREIISFTQGRQSWDSKAGSILELAVLCCLLVLPPFFQYDTELNDSYVLRPPH